MAGQNQSRRHQTVAEPSALRKAGEPVTTLAGAKALELKPLETNKVRDYSGVYS